MGVAFAHGRVVHGCRDVLAVTGGQHGQSIVVLHLIVAGRPSRGMVRVAIV